jgi:pyrroloquinoline quinone biosynthesis protein E
MNNVKFKIYISSIKKSKALFNAFLSVIFGRTFINTPFMPFIVQIEPTTKCNLNCISCTHSTYTKDMIGDLSFENFKKIINQIPTALIVKLQGMGEPFFNHDIVNMLKYSKQKGMITEVISNGTILNEEALKYLDSLVFSFDGATKKTYEKIRVGSNFERVVGNIKKAVKLKKDTTICMSIVVLKENINELKEFVDLAKGLGVDAVGFSPVEQWEVEESQKRNQKSVIKNESVISLSRQ